MQIFIPYQSPLYCAKTLYGDKRFQKQIIECKQILAAIDGAIPWSKHPCVLMYKEHRKWLYYYMQVFTAYRDYKKGNDKALVAALFYDGYAEKVTPPFIDDAICIQHRKRLFTKNSEKYPQFAEYGTSEENWYYVSGQIVKYVNGKRIN